MTEATGAESAAAAAPKAGFIIETLDGWHIVRAVRHDGSYGDIVAEAGCEEADGIPASLQRVVDRCNEALANDEAWALRLVDVSAGELRR